MSEIKLIKELNEALCTLQSIDKINGNHIVRIKVLMDALLSAQQDCVASFCMILVTLEKEIKQAITKDIKCHSEKINNIKIIIDDFLQNEISNE